MQRHALSVLPALALWLGLCTQAMAEGAAPVIGLHENTPHVTALTGVRLVRSPGVVVEGATVVVRDGWIEAAGAGVAVPPDAVVRNMAGKTIYPAFIDLFSSYGVSKEAADKAAALGSRSWNPAVRPQLKAATLFKADSAAAGSFRKAGFAAALT
ncbi:hypothetical protein LLH00_01755, partial [bacterium]|nr:hypothetical protein [bacterium]